MKVDKGIQGRKGLKRDKGIEKQKKCGVGERGQSKLRIREKVIWEPTTSQTLKKEKRI